MSNSTHRLAPHLSLAILAALAFTASVAAQSSSQDPVQPLSAQIRESRLRLEHIREEQRRLRSEMDQLSARAHDLSDELENIDRQISNQEVLVRELDNQLEIRDRSVTAVTGDLLRTRDQLVEKRALFAHRARDLYKRGPTADVQILLAAESFSELINRYRYLYLVALHDRLLVRQIEELNDQLRLKYDQLRREARGLRDVRNDKVRELQEFYSLEQARGRRLRAFRGLRATTERRLGELERDESELNNLVGRLEREREAAEALAAGLPTRGTLTPSVKGTLEWPVTGPVIYGYGQQRNADGTVILRQGVGIAAAEGQPVKAVSSGTVVFAEPYLGYGPSVILSHGGGYYSVYLYLSDITVGQGEVVTIGQVVGTVGGTGTPEGPHLEFQIRENRRAVDPVPWLQRSRG